MAWLPIVIYVPALAFNQGEITLSDSLVSKTKILIPHQLLE